MGGQFFATSGQEYLIRLSHDERATALTLSWSTVPRPLNDDFSMAIAIENASGSINGSNEGATLEPRELFRTTAATVWYRWKAGKDGFLHFKVSERRLHVLAFTGTDLSNLRLVSGYRREHATFAAQAGQDYWILIGSSDAYGSGRKFVLNWTNGWVGNNDLFSNAEEIPRESTSQRLDIDYRSSVEPESSGISTEWWSWTAPEDGSYTWQLDDLTRNSGGAGDKLMVSIFEGESLSQLRLVATNGERMNNEFVFDAVANQRYWIVAGLPIHDQWAFDWNYHTADLIIVWGLTPHNDSVSQAASLTGLSGSVSGSNEFGTHSVGERIDVLGRSTIWWTYEATESGWIRFHVDGEGSPWALNVHDGSAENDRELRLIASDRSQRSENEVRFEAEAGVTYTIALGLRDGGRGGEFSLEWDKVESPTWLRYAGQFTNWNLDSQGNRVVLRDLGDIVIPDHGKVLYVTSEPGLHVFNRDEVTGELEHIELLETDFDISSSALIWDSHRNRLLAKTLNPCG